MWQGRMTTTGAALATVNGLSVGQVAVLQAREPAKALADNEARFRAGGVAVAEKIQDETRKTLTSHRQMMDRLGVSGTPAMLYKDAEGKIRLQRGMTDLDTLTQVIGLPPRPIDDPELARFKSAPAG